MSVPSNDAPKGMVLEICASSVRSVQNACKGGADRIELCTGIELGGLTPSPGLIEFAVRHSSVPIHVLLRPRPGDFVFSAEEVDVMCADATAAASMGAKGIVIGVLTCDGAVDQVACRKIMASAPGLAVTFHRAFDVCADRDAALEACVEMGVHRILSSGGAPTAEAGAGELARLVAKGGGRVRPSAPPADTIVALARFAHPRFTQIRILAGGGVSPLSVADLVQAGVRELHTTAKRRFTSAGSGGGSHDVQIGTAKGDHESWFETCKDIVITFRMALAEAEAASARAVR